MIFYCLYALKYLLNKQIKEQNCFILVWCNIHIKVSAFHNYILIVKTGSVNLDAVKIRLSDFNRKYSRTKRFAISSFELNKEYQLITISRFDQAALALNYLEAVNTDKYVLSIFQNENDYKQFVISNENYMLFYKDKKVDNYVEFYERFYN